MIVEKMTKEECLEFLRQVRFGRVACVRDDRPYVVPMYFISDDLHLYGFSTLGQKIKWMRANPNVCVEMDEVIDHLHWRTLIINGTYEELSDRPDKTSVREYALELLQRRAMWWQPASASSKVGEATPVFFRIRIDELSGHRARPDEIEEGAFSPEFRRTTQPRIFDRVRKLLP